MRNWIIGLSTSLVLMAAPAVAFAATPVHVTLNAPVSTPATACNGDTIDLSGTLYGTGNLVVSNNGSEHLVATVGYSDLKGTDQVTGTQYVATGRVSEQENVTVSNTEEATLVGQVELIGQGSAPNRSETIFEHVTINANGTVTVDNTYAKTTGC